MDEPEFAYRDNHIYFGVDAITVDYTIYEAFYTVTDLSISSGQDPASKNKIGDVHSFSTNVSQDKYLNFEVGRHATGDVGHWWNIKIGPDHNTFNQDAGRLNFAFLGTLSLTLENPDKTKPAIKATFQGIGLAQGSSALSNNWWFGGTSCQYYPGAGANIVRAAGVDAQNNPVHFYFRRGAATEPNYVVLAGVEFN